MFIVLMGCFSALSAACCEVYMVEHGVTFNTEHCAGTSVQEVRS